MCVIGFPEPPGGEPTASEVTDHSLVLSWYGSMYDGGSVVTGYQVEMCTLPDKKWHKVASSVNTSCSVPGLSKGQRYIFRVRAENRYGSSHPSKESKIIRLDDFLQDDSSADEEPKRSGEGSFRDRVPVRGEGVQPPAGRQGDPVPEGEGQGEGAAGDRDHEQAAAPQAHAGAGGIRERTQHDHGHGIHLRRGAVRKGDRRRFRPHGTGLHPLHAPDLRRCCLHAQERRSTPGFEARKHPLQNSYFPKIKIIDFGLARIYKRDESLRILFGTPEFVAPEVINYEPVCPASDMWSVGVICYVLLSGLSPFMGDNDTETFANITRGEMDFDDEAFDEISDDAKDFISSLLVKNVRNRMSSEQCLKHPWLATAGLSQKRPLSTEKLKRFIIRRKWQKSGTAIRALGRMVSLSRSSLGSSCDSYSPLGSPTSSRSRSRSSIMSRSETTESGESDVFQDLSR
ncbi:hypothetical protein CDAR_246092 [Caerostris darwini]|uniref:Uncharacterized protein n=1 Tax=Caerostris darwini TaxID=1538125 RepID=A0AAV4QSF0_9ARAC|nr:hypothetical protein CDAR_246092 [Caerostris darwini]